MEKYRERRKFRFINFLKFNMIMMMIYLMVLFLFRVNDTIIALNCMENPELFSLDFNNYRVNALGKSYSMESLMREIPRLRSE